MCVCVCVCVSRARLNRRQVVDVVLEQEVPRQDVVEDDLNFTVEKCAGVVCVHLV